MKDDSSHAYFAEMYNSNRISPSAELRFELRDDDVGNDDLLISTQGPINEFLGYQEIEYKGNWFSFIGIWRAEYKDGK